MTYPATQLTTPTRHLDRTTYDRAAVHELLDEQFFGHVGFTVDGAARVLPTMFVRVGETLFLHGSTGASWLLKARRDGGIPVVLSVAAVDALLLARSQPNHGFNYRSVIIHGTATLVEDEAAKRAAMSALIDKVAPGRSTEVRVPNAAEIAMTAVLRLDLEFVSMKRRAGGVLDDPEDLDLPVWAGVVPMTVVRGVGVPAEGVTVPTPAYVPTRSRWFAAPTLVGKHVTIEPLQIEQVPELFAALDDYEVWQHIPRMQPKSVAELQAMIVTGLADPTRVPMIQKLTETGEIVGTTSYYDVNETFGSIAIGWTQIGKPWWRTAINTEAKLLLLTHAFETLGAERVVWHTDSRNLRSQAAITRLGAQREGVLRHQRLRPDGTWRDSVQYSMIAEEWPEARERLVVWAYRGSNRHTG